MKVQQKILSRAILILAIKNGKVASSISIKLYTMIKFSQRKKLCNMIIQECNGI